MSAGPTRWQLLFSSMRLRIVAAVVALLLLSSIASVLVLRGVLFDRLDEEIRLDLAQETEEFRLLAAGIDPDTGEAFGDDVASVFDVYFAREVPDEGETLLAFVDGRLYRSARSQDGAAAEELQGAIDHWLALDAPEAGGIDTPIGRARYSAVPLEGDGNLFVVANFPAFERTEIDDAVRVQGITQIATLVVASLLGLLLAGRVLRPLRQLADTARRISESDLTRRIPVRGRGEASQIARTFHDMLARLEQAFTAQRRFLDDAGHELRAPLTVVRGHLELLELDTDPEERQETVALVIEEIDRMNRIVGDLLLLAAAEQPDFLVLEPVDVEELTTGLLRRVTALGEREWRLDQVGGGVIGADGQRLVQAMIQLAQNASQHTSRGDVIRIGSAVEASAVRLWVHDTGAGVPPQDADRIFDRFTRGTNRRGSGAGLGLSIVQAIATAHHGVVRLVPVPVGARFEIVLPAAVPPSRPSTAGRPLSPAARPGR